MVIATCSMRNCTYPHQFYMAALEYLSGIKSCRSTFCLIHQSWPLAWIVQTFFKIKYTNPSIGILTFASKSWQPLLYKSLKSEILTTTTTRPRNMYKLKKKTHPYGRDLNGRGLIYLLTKISRPRFNFGAKRKFELQNVVLGGHPRLHSCWWWFPEVSTLPVIEKLIA